MTPIRMPRYSNTVHPRQFGFFGSCEVELRSASELDLRFVLIARIDERGDRIGDGPSLRTAVRTRDFFRHPAPQPDFRPLRQTGGPLATLVRFGTEYGPIAG